MTDNELLNLSTLLDQSYYANHLKITSSIFSQIEPTVRTAIESNRDKLYEFENTKITKNIKSLSTKQHFEQLTEDLLNSIEAIIFASYDRNDKVILTDKSIRSQYMNAIKYNGIVLFDKFACLYYAYILYQIINKQINIIYDITKPELKQLDKNDAIIKIILICLTITIIVSGIVISFRYSQQDKVNTIDVPV